MSRAFGRMIHIPRSRGVVTGLAIVLLGIWGGLVPFVGPHFHYAFGSYASLHFTWERLWLDVVPAAAAVLGGAMLVLAASRPAGAIGAWLAAVAGVWFAVGVPLSTLWQGAGHFGIGPALGGHVHQATEWVGYFYGLGVGITFLAAFALGRLSVLSVRDARTAEERSARPPVETATVQTAPSAASAASIDNPRSNGGEQESQTRESSSRPLRRKRPQTARRKPSDDPERANAT